MPEIGFLISFYIFFGIFLPGSRMNGIRVYNLFLSFSAYLIPFWLKIMPERGFLVFLVFFHFFWNFLSRVECQQNFFLSFSAYIIPFWLKIMPEMVFFNFLNFLAFFFGISLHGSSMNGIQV